MLKLFCVLLQFDQSRKRVWLEKEMSFQPKGPSKKRHFSIKFLVLLFFSLIKKGQEVETVPKKSLEQSGQVHCHAPASSQQMQCFVGEKPSSLQKKGGKWLKMWEPPPPCQMPATVQKKKKCGPSTPWALDTPPQFFSRCVRSSAKRSVVPPEGGHWTPPRTGPGGGVIVTKSV